MAAQSKDQQQRHGKGRGLTGSLGLTGDQWSLGWGLDEGLDEQGRSDDFPESK